MALAVAADAATELGRYDEAIEHVDRMLSVRPTLPALSRAAHLRFLHGDIEGARELANDAMQQAREGEPEALWVRLQLSELHAAEGNHEAAVSEVGKAAQTFPNSAAPHIQLARLAEARGEFAQASTHYKKAAESLTTPEIVLGMLRTAVALQDRIAMRKLVTILDGMAKLDAINGDMNARTYADYYLIKRDIGAAKRSAMIEYARRPDIYSQSQLAWIAFSAGDIAVARTHATASLSTQSSDPLIAYRAGRILMAAGDTDRGSSLVQSALARAPGLNASANLRVALAVSRTRPTR